MPQDNSANDAHLDGALAASSGAVAAENEPFLSASDLVRDADHQRRLSTEATHESDARPRVHRARSDVEMRTRLLHALPPRLSQWLHASAGSNIRDDGSSGRRRSPPPSSDGTTPTPLHVPVTLRVLPGNAPRHSVVPRQSSSMTHAIRIDPDADDNDDETLPRLLPLDTTAILTRRENDPASQLGTSPIGSPRSSTSSDDASQSEEPSTFEEFQPLLRRCHHTLPFVALFLLYFVYQHVVGLAVFALGSTAIAGLDQRLRAQIALKENANRFYLVGIAVMCGIDMFVISSLDGELNPLRHLTYKLQAPDSEDKSETSYGALILDLLWIILLNDFIVRFMSLAVKALVAAVGPDTLRCMRSTSSVGSPSSGPTSPEMGLEAGQRRKLTLSNVSFHRRKRKLYGIIELSSIFFRSLLATHPWCSYYQLCGSKFMANVFTFFYVFGKSVTLGSQGKRMIKLIRSFMTLGLEHASYVARDELVEAGSPDCSICYEAMQTPVKLSCSHFFCEECVMEWFDRERSCPLCRAPIVSTAQADGEPKPQYLDGSTSLFPQLF